MDNKEIGKFISICRKEKNMTQKQLADALGITNKAVSKWETGEGYPDITLLPQLAAELNISIDELLSGKRNEEAKMKKKESNKKVIVLTSIAVLMLAFSIYFIGHYYGIIMNPSVILSVFMIGVSIEIFIYIKLSR